MFEKISKDKKVILITGISDGVRKETETTLAKQGHINNHSW